MKKNATVLFFSLILFFALNSETFTQMPPHPSLVEKIKKGIIELPEIIKNKSELRARGIDASWKVQTNQKLNSPFNIDKNRVVGPASAPTGNWRALVILVQFSDKAQQVNASYFDNLIFSQTSGTLWDYYKKVSYNALDIVTVNLPSSIGWQTAPQTYAYYCNNNYGLGSYPKNAQRLVENVVTLVNPSVDFSNYDNDGDGYVDALFVVHSGTGAEVTGNTTDIWSHAWSTSYDMSVDGVKVRRYSMEPEYWLSAGDMTIGVYAHELGHAAFGLPDLYDTDNSSEGLGYWSLMASGSWNGTLGNSPSFPDAWSHIQMGYATPTNVTTNLTGQTIVQTEQTPQIFKLWRNGSPGSQYFLVQNRQKTGYDSGLPGSGLAIYHIDESVTTDNDNEWYPGHTTSGHYLVALEQADGLWQLEKTSRGDAGDLYPGSSNVINFNNGTTPNSKDYSSSATNVSVSNISSSSSTMTADLLITQVTPTVTLTSPNGGENWKVGTSQNITWTSSNVTNVKLEYSINNGTSWTTIIASTSASTGSYSWLIPGYPSSNCKVRISDASDSGVNDQSDNTFTIYQPTVTLTAPNGSESWKVGSSNNITWTSSNVTNVKLEYTTNNGASWITIISFTSASAGSYSWTVPNTPSTICKVRVSDFSDGNISDASNNVFTIYQPSLVLLTPNGGENWTAGTSQNITWTSSNVANVKLEYTTDNGANWNTITASTPASAGSYSWNIPNTPSTNCKVKISDTGDASVTDESNNVFVIEEQLITLLTPNGDESWKVGTNQSITWTSSNVANVKLEYTTNNGTSWGTIIESTPALTGSYSWTVPNAPSTNCKVRISDASNVVKNDLSDNVFTIYQPTIALTTPNGGEGWKVGTNQNITWTSSNVANTKLEYTTNNGINWSTLIESTLASTGSYNWTVPNSPSTNCKVRISDASDSSINDLSDNVFNIYQPTITLTTPNGGESWKLGTNQNITWTSSNVANAKLEYTTNNGINWSTIIESTPASTGSYSWTIPNAPSTNCKVRISDASDPAINDLSDNVFTVYQPTITLTTPNGGESWKVGTNQNITWKSSNVANAKLEYTTNNGISWSTIIESTPASTGSYSWTIPNAPSTNCKVRISDASDAATNDISNNLFTIYQSSVVMTTPNGGENWKVGTNQNITWISSNVANVKLEYTTNNGINWSTIIESTPASTGSYSWTVPNAPSTNCKVRISDASDPAINDLSNNVFTIYRPTIVLTTPNGGENWKIGTTQNIIWTSSNVVNVKLEYTINNGTSWSTIIESTSASTGSYSWTVLNAPSTNCKVRISDASDSAINDISDNVFTIYQPTITLTTPNGGENWKVGTTQNIIWTSSDIANVKLEFTTNNGTSWSTIIESTPASTGSYSWTIPNAPSTNCKVRISDASDSAINDISDNVFTIYQPTITLTTPNGGENWKVGTTQNITWTSSNVENAKLEYTTNNGISWGTIIESTPASTGSYSWTVPNAPSINCKVRISEVGDALVNDLSDNVFTIYQPTIALTTPNGGENWKVETTQNITWTSSDVANAKLEYTTNNGISWSTIIESTPASIGSYSWTVPNASSTNCKIRISDASDSAINDISDNVFTIYQPTITLTTPNGGEIWKVGTIKNINWTSSNVANAKLEYTTNNGTSWSTIIESTPASTGSYNWTVPNTPSTNCKVRISDASDSAINDISDNVFTIYQPTITLTTPNGGENWKVGTNQNITWTSSNVVNAKLEYTTNNGTNWSTIIESTSVSTESYSWTIPNTPSTNCKIRISDASDSAINDLSDNVFTIYQPTLVLTSPNGGENWLVGSTQNITWKSSDIRNIKIEYTTNGGSNWLLLAENVNSSLKSVAWRIPNYPSQHYKVRITALEDSQYNDESNSEFIVYQPTLAITVPNGEERWRVGTTKNITWVSSDIANVKLEFTTNNGTNWSTIIESTPASTGSYSWTVPNAPSTNCKVRISDASDSAINDISDNVFTIYQPTITLTTPNGGENWKVGTTQNITWTSSNVENAKLEYTTNNGISWGTIIESTPASTGSYSWTVPNAPSTNCKVRISDASDSAINDISDNVFTIYQPTITLTTPNGGENWKVGSSNNITWTSSNVANVKLEYTTNNGISWSTIIESTPAPTGSYSWTVPNAPSINCKVRISEVGDALINDLSDNVFTIYQPTLALTTPNGGENWRVGTNQNITWISSNVTNVKLEYTTNNGTSWSTIIESTPASTGSYSWTVPNAPSINCKVRISEVGDALINDLSDNVFTIYQPTLALTTPNGGENWRVGTNQNITWISSNVANVKLEYTTNNGINWSTIIESTPVPTGSYSWTIPNTPLTNCKVRISEVGDSAINDLSDNVFTIYQPTLALTTPNGGENWRVGTNQNITWTSSNVANVKLEYTTNNGINWSTIIESTPVPTGSYSWTIPNTPLTNCKVRISEVGDSAINDLSDNVFTIYQPTLALTSPNGGENWLVGSTQNITWKSSDIKNIKIEYTTNGGLNWLLLAENVNSSLKSVVWKIPNYPSQHYKIRITALEDSQYNDESNNEFIVYQPTITLTTPNGGEIWKVGTIKNINWTSSNVSNAKLEYTTNNGTSWSTIIESTPTSTESFSWTVPNTPSTNCKVRISDASDSAINDLSDNVFTIYQPTITLTAPNGGENWVVGTTKNITWTSINVADVKLEYTTNNGTVWNTIVESTPASRGNYGWMVPDNPSEHCIIKITAVEDILVYDNSDNEFTINSVPEIQLVTPNGDEKWKVGTTRNISWVAKNVSKLNIQLSTDNGSDWLIVKENVLASLGQLNWNIPDSCSKHCLLRIVDADHSEYSDTNDQAFIIWKPIEVTKITIAGQNNLNFDPTYISLSAFVSNPAPVTVTFYEYEGSQGGNLPDSVIDISDFYWQVISPGISFTNGEISIPGYLAGETSDSTYNVWLKRENNNEDWICIGGASLSGMLSNTSTFNIFSEFAIGKKINAPVPVELISLNASVKGSNIVLNWKTATETNNRGFEIERKIVPEQKSENSIEFASIVFVPGKGNSTRVNEYNYTDKNITGNGKAIYRLKQIDFDGRNNLSSCVEVKLEVKPKAYSLSQNYPNPFNPTTKIRYQLPEAGWVTLKVYNLLGNEIATLVNEKKNAGNYDVEFSANNVSSGIYIYKLSCGNYTSTKRMVLLK